MIGLLPLTALSWESTFAARAPLVHLVAHYEDSSGPHRLELWRAADGRLRRDTDNALTLLVTHAPSGEPRYRVYDHDRRLAITVSRSSLHRVGLFSDLQSLAHVVNRPIGHYTITDEKRREKNRIGDCHWFALAAPPDSPPQHVCYSTRWGVPLLIRNAEGNVRFEVHAIDTAVADGSFIPVAAGYGEIDADSDIRPED
jgi:hypothetical protein